MIKRHEVTFALGANLSSILELEGQTLVAIEIPATINGNELHLLSAAGDGLNKPLIADFKVVADETGAALKFAGLAASRVLVAVAMSRALSPLRWLAFQSKTTGTPENQAAARTLVVLTKDD